MRAPDLITLLNTLNDDNINARMVGGCIRNMLTDKDIDDIDIACTLPPQQFQEKLNAKGIKTIPTGIDHGTITAHINGKNYEITTLRHDVIPDGRHTTVDFTANWHEDAKRRDFTINALYADIDGSIYDPTDMGLNDIEKQIVRFIGNPEKRIIEDHLRILRFFRFDAQFNRNAPDELSFQACKNHAEKIHLLSDERIFDEMRKILMNDNAPIAIDRLRQASVFDFNIQDADVLSRLITLQNQLSLPHISPRIFIINKIEKYNKNKKINNFINKIEDLKKEWDNDIKRSLYYYDRDIVIQTLLILKSQGNTIQDHTISDAMTLPKPVLPITATDIMNTLKICQGPQIGQTLKDAEELWIKSDFRLNHNDLLQTLAKNKR